MDVIYVDMIMDRDHNVNGCVVCVCVCDDYCVVDVQLATEFMIDPID